MTDIYEFSGLSEGAYAAAQEAIGATLEGAAYNPSKVCHRSLVLQAHFLSPPVQPSLAISIHNTLTPNFFTRTHFIYPWTLCRIPISLHFTSLQNVRCT